MLVSLKRRRRDFFLIHFLLAALQRDRAVASDYSEGPSCVNCQADRAGRDGAFLCLQSKQNTRPPTTVIKYTVTRRVTFCYTERIESSVNHVCAVPALVSSTCCLK